MTKSSPEVLAQVRRTFSSLSFSLDSVTLGKHFAESALSKRQAVALERHRGKLLHEFMYELVTAGSEDRHQLFTDFETLSAIEDEKGELFGGLYSFYSWLDESGEEK